MLGYDKYLKILTEIINSGTKVSRILKLEEEN